MADQVPAYEGWAIVEVMGRRRLAGYVRPATMYGAEFARVDVPAVDDQPAQTQYVGGGSIYMLHPVDEAIARIAAKAMPEPPVSRWELRQALPAAESAAPEPGGWVDPDDYADADD